MKVSFSSLSGLSLLKIGLCANLCGCLIRSGAIMAAELLGYSVLRTMDAAQGLGLLILKSAVIGIAFGLLMTLIFILGALAARLAGQRTPTLEIDVAPDVARHFE